MYTVLYWYYTILYYTILYYTILHYTILLFSKGGKGIESIGGTRVFIFLGEKRYMFLLEVRFVCYDDKSKVGTWSK